MAKSSKIEDYWRQNNIESLLKELTHNLAQRMPPDPAVAIVQYLQKKFPKSFKTSIDNNTNMGTTSKTMTSSLQSQNIFSPRSDANSDVGNTMDMERRGSNQSQVSGIATVPTIGSAFTDLLKQNVSTDLFSMGYKKPTFILFIDKRYKRGTRNEYKKSCFC
jgi:hypothetical protein